MIAPILTNGFPVSTDNVSHSLPSLRRKIGTAFAAILSLLPHRLAELARTRAFLPQFNFRIVSDGYTLVCSCPMPENGIGR